MFRFEKILNDKIQDDIDKIIVTQVNDNLSYYKHPDGTIETYARCPNCGEDKCFNDKINEDDIEYYNCRYCSANLKTGELEDDYIIIYVTDISQLKKLVNKAIKKGYKPIGKMGESPYNWIYQAMIKEGV